MQPVDYLAITKWYKKPEKWPRLCHMGTDLREQGLDCFQKSLLTCASGKSSLKLEGLKTQPSYNAYCRCNNRTFKIVSPRCKCKATLALPFQISCKNSLKDVSLSFLPSLACLKETQIKWNTIHNCGPSSVSNWTPSSLYWIVVTYFHVQVSCNHISGDNIHVGRNI